MLDVYPTHPAYQSPGPAEHRRAHLAGNKMVGLFFHYLWWRFKFARKDPPFVVRNDSTLGRRGGMDPSRPIRLLLSSATQPMHRLPRNGAHRPVLTKCRRPDLPSERRPNDRTRRRTPILVNDRVPDKRCGSRQWTESGPDGPTHGMDDPSAYNWTADQWPRRWHRSKSRTEHRVHGAAIKGPAGCKPAGCKSAGCKPATVPWDHPRPPDPVMIQVHAVPEPPGGMVHLIPRCHHGPPPDEIRLVRNHRRRRPVFER